MEKFLDALAVAIVGLTFVAILVVIYLKWQVALVIPASFSIPWSIARVLAILDKRL